jgi:two-component system, HptB-dependent secretion and biofilm response regulator
MNQKTCQTLFAIVTELVTNSIDHGILGLSSNLKQSPEGFMQYFLTREKLLNNLNDDDFIELRLDWMEIESCKKLIITCRDSGEGYDYTQRRSLDNQQYAGRGLILVRNLAESVEIYAPGNFIKIIL